MKLKDWLVNKTENDVVKIGFEHGINFFYCGGCFDGLDFLLDNLSESYYRQLLKRKEYLYSIIDTLDNDKALKCLDHLDKLMQKPFSIMYREIVEITESIDEFGATIIYVDGDGNGKYWSTSECSHDKDMRELVDIMKKKHEMKKKRRKKVVMNKNGILEEV